MCGGLEFEYVSTATQPVRAELVNVLCKDDADPAAAFFHRKKVHHDEKNIRDAFLALHHGLDLLKKLTYGYDGRCSLFLSIVTTNQADVLQFDLPHAHHQPSPSLLCCQHPAGLINTLHAIAGAGSRAVEVQVAGD
jgi:hypothetical protein